MRPVSTSVFRSVAAALLALAALIGGAGLSLWRPRDANAQEPTAAAGELTGTVKVVERDGVAHAIADAVVWIPGLAAAPAGPAQMASQEKRFAPHVLAVPVGATVSFPNLDRIYHNVFSSTPGQVFDLGLYRNGASRERRFDSAGLVRVYCNIHGQMAGSIRVVDGAFAVSAADGAFRMLGVPPGPHSVHFWHERGGESEATAVMPPKGGLALSLVLDASRFVATVHKNKRGQDYPPPSLDDDRY